MSPAEAAARALGVRPDEVVLDPAGTSGRVWRARAGGNACHVKRHSSRRTFGQAKGALTNWTPRLGRSPQLLLEHGPSLLMATSSLPGAPMADTHFDLSGKLVVLDRVRAAGALLRDLHALPHQDVDGLPLCEALRRRASAAAAAAAPFVDEQSIRRAVDLVTAARSASERRVPCHRDYGAHNWLAHGHAVAVIDWEHARADTPFADLERATELIDGEAAEAFLDGYGASTSLLRSPMFRGQVALAALTRIAWAVPRGARRFEASGRRRLAAVLEDRSA